jgi:hypothetical protein
MPKIAIIREHDNCWVLRHEDHDPEDRGSLDGYRYSFTSHFRTIGNHTGAHFFDDLTTVVKVLHWLKAEYGQHETYKVWMELGSF